MPNIFNVWKDEEWEEPDIKESFDPDRTSLTLKFIKKQAVKTNRNQEKIRLYLQEQGTAKTSDIAEMLDLSVSRVRAILSEMDNIEALGRNRARRYRLRKEPE